jgi:hypothetical protein
MFSLSPPKKKPCKKFTKTFKKEEDTLTYLFTTGKDSPMSSGGRRGKGYLNGMGDYVSLPNNQHLKKQGYVKGKQR